MFFKFLEDRTIAIEESVIDAHRIGKLRNTTTADIIQSECYSQIQRDIIALELSDLHMFYGTEEENGKDIQQPAE